jgi:hypothetical protein
MTKKRPEGSWVVMCCILLHLLCCGVPLLVLSGVSLGLLFPRWPVIAVVLAVAGVVGFVWHLKRGCATCPRDERRCSVGDGAGRGLLPAPKRRI